MASINFHHKEISAKIVYYGPGLCGKTTSLQGIYGSLPDERREQFVSLATEVDRTIFFDFLPLQIHRVRDFKIRLQLYTVPGQVFYNATRKLVLNGVDGIVFVCDSQLAMRDGNLESLQNLEQNLQELGLEIENIPLVIQYNKRDLPRVLPQEEMEQIYNRWNVPTFPTVATTGEGLLEALHSITKLVIKDLKRKGLASQIRGPKVSAPEPETTEPGSMAGAIAQAMEAEPVTVDSLWPTPSSNLAGRSIDDARKSGDWAAMVKAIHGLLGAEAKLWQEANDESGESPVPMFLLERGVPGERYMAFIRTMQSVEAGKPVDKGEAMNGLVMLLQALW